MFWKDAFYSTGAGCTYVCIMHVICFDLFRILFFHHRLALFAFLFSGFSHHISCALLSQTWNEIDGGGRVKIQARSADRRVH